MSSELPVMDLTFRGVELRVETLRLLESSCRRLLASLGARPRVHVLLERRHVAEEVHVYVAVERGATLLRARGLHGDEFRAIQRAFASFAVRHVPTTTPLAWTGAVARA